MIISAKELIDLCEAAYDLDKQAANLKKRVADMLGGYANDNKVSKTAVNQAYKAFVSFKNGKVTTQDEDYFTLQAIVEEHFSGEENPNAADTVAG